MDRVSKLLRDVIWNRRRAFYAAAVERDVITVEQACELMNLHRERDEAQDREDGMH